MVRTRMTVGTSLWAAALALWGMGSAWADFETGVKAYEAGAYEDAYKAWSEAAAAGDARSQWNLGNLYLAGQGMEKRDAEAAAENYRAAARQGFAEAQVSLATLYRVGEGVPRDLRKATDWLYSAAVQGHPLAMVDLADIFLEGVEDWVNPTPGHALDWYRLAGLQQVAIAQVKLGQMYFYGLGTQPDRSYAYAWLTAAANLAKGEIEPAWSKRVWPLDKAIASGDPDEGPKPLRDLILELRRELGGELTEDERRKGLAQLKQLEFVPVLPGGGYALGDRSEPLSVAKRDPNSPALRPISEENRPAPVGDEIFIKPLKAPGAR